MSAAAEPKQTCSPCSLSPGKGKRTYEITVKTLRRTRKTNFVDAEGQRRRVKHEETMNARPRMESTDLG